MPRTQHYIDRIVDDSNEEEMSFPSEALWAHECERYLGISQGNTPLHRDEILAKDTKT